MRRTGMVYIVGAGPGDPGLLTLRAASVLRSADLIIYDDLVGGDILDIAGRCTRMARARDLGPDGALRAMIDGAAAGMTVVRLKGGDPTIFGRTCEDVAALREAGVCFEIIPGVSSVNAAAALARVPLTGIHSLAVAIVSGHDDTDDPRCSVRWEEIARGADTVVIMMGAKHAGAIARKLIACGLPPETPVTVIERCYMEGESIQYSSLCELGAGRISPEAPVVVIVGGECTTADFPTVHSPIKHGKIKI